MKQSAEPGGGPNGQQGLGRGTGAGRAGPRADDGSGPAEPRGGPNGQQGSDRGTRASRAGPRADEGLHLAEGGAEELVLQEDEVEWGVDGGGVGDPALQHALAVIRAKGERIM